MDSESRVPPLARQQGAGYCPLDARRRAGALRDGGPAVSDGSPAAAYAQVQEKVVQVTRFQGGLGGGHDLGGGEQCAALLPGQRPLAV